MKFDLPQFDLLIPGAAAVLLELIGSLWVNARLTHVSATKWGKRFICCSLTEYTVGLVSVCMISQTSKHLKSHAAV